MSQAPPARTRRCKLNFGCTIKWLPGAADAWALDRFLPARRQAAPSGFEDLMLAVVMLLGSGAYAAAAAGAPPAGHFGLAVNRYAHSTAPNRRFVDLVGLQREEAFSIAAQQPLLVGIAEEVCLAHQAANALLAQRKRRVRAEHHALHTHLGHKHLQCGRVEDGSVHIEALRIVRRRVRANLADDDALSREHKVVAAAARLKLSAPAVSNALARLRRATGDELFTRVSGGMQPTSFAQSIAPAIGDALAAIDNALTARAPFAAAHSARSFCVAMTDIGEIHFLPRLLQQVQRAAPAVALSTVRDSAIDLRHEMASGGVDLAVGWLPDLEAGFHQRRLFTQRYVCLMSQRNPLVRGSLTKARFLAARHVQALAEGTGHQRVEKLLRRAGLSRELVLTVPQFVALPFIVAESELVAVVPEVLAERTLDALQLVRRDMPVALPTFEVNLFWHERVHRDAANQWLRDLVVQLFVA